VDGVCGAGFLGWWAAAPGDRFAWLAEEAFNPETLDLGAGGRRHGMARCGDGAAGLGGLT